MQRNTFQNIPNEINRNSIEDISSFRQSVKGRKLILDMGCGHGDFLLEKTVKYPQNHFVGIEISRKRASKTSDRLHKRNIPNYHVIDSEGELALKLIFAEKSVDEIHINFPDPWLRKRQWKNRIFKPSFLIQVIRVLKPGGFLYFVSDVAEYAEHVLKIIEEFPGLTSQYEKGIEKNLYEKFPTLFYQKMSPLRDINYICFRKN